MSSPLARFSSAYSRSTFSQKPANSMAGMRQSGFQKVQNPSGANSAVNSVNVKTDLM